MTKQWAPMLEEETPQQRNRDIVKEVWELVNIDHSKSLDMLGGPKVHHTTEPLNARLEEVYKAYNEYSTPELMGYLRCSSMWKNSLPAWDKLLKVSYQQAIERNSQQFADEVFIGLI